MKKMNKKIYHTGFAALLLLMMSSCTEWLTLKPESEILLDDYWQSESDVECVLAACYRGMTEDDVIYRMIVWGELRSDNMEEGSGFPSKREDMGKILEGDLSSSNAYCSWGAFYSVINYCNTLLYYAPLVIDRDKNFTTSDLNRVKAEALSVRALCYFYLVRAFKEVPWITDPSISDAQEFNISKSNESLVMDSITEDLEWARNYAVEGFSTTIQTKGRFTKNGVNALLADVYLWQQNYSKCIEACNRVLSDANLMLVTSKLAYAQVFYKGSSTESILELQFDDNIQKNNPTFNLYGVLGDPFGELCFPSNLAQNILTGTAGLYSPFVYTPDGSTKIESQDDIRAKDSYRLSGGLFFIFKYAGIARSENTSNTSSYSYRSSTPNWIIYRLSDIYLMKAEALTYKNPMDLPLAISMVNKSYARSNEDMDTLMLSNYATQAKMSSLVLRERQREFLFEGKRWFDLVRMARRDSTTDDVNTFLEHKLSGSTESLSVSVLNGLYMPIAKSELEANPNMEQNPYYEETNGSTRK
jgi:starch-binding outer membrane protein, SusD/RagB family